MAIGETGQYEPLDLAAHAHAGPEVLGPGPSIAGGPRTFHGIPFRVACPPGTEAPAFVLVEPGAPRTVIPVGRQAARVVIAHLRLPGVSVRGRAADRRTGGRLHLRDRGSITGRGAHPGAVRAERASRNLGLAGPVSRGLSGDQRAARPPPRRMGGGWAPGRPRSPTAAGTPRCPSGPGRARIRRTGWRRSGSVARGSRVLVAAITLSNADEEPFVRDAALPVRVTLSGADRPAGRDDLSVEADRGVATYVYPLPRRDLETFLSDPLKGWGEAPWILESPHAYLAVAGTPFGNRDCRIGRPGAGQDPVGRGRGNGIDGERRRSGRTWSSRAATGCTSGWWTTNPGGQCHAGCTSVRRRAFPTSPTDTTITSTPTSGPGTSTSAVTSGSGGSRTHTSTGPARAGSPPERSSSTSPAGSSTNLSAS